MNPSNPKDLVAKKRNRNLLAKHLRESKQYKQKTIPANNYNRQSFKRETKNETR